VRRLPRASAVDRSEFLTRLAAGRSIVHVGFAGESRADIGELVESPTWLHGRLAAVASHAVGIDIDPAAVERARRAGFEAFAADASDAVALRALGIQADVVVAGEIIEHVERPGEFLDAMRAIGRRGGMLVVTTPNAASLLNPLAAMGRYELINPDHVAFYSCFTLTNLMRRHGWEVTQMATYAFPFAKEAWRGSGVHAVGRALAAAQQVVARVWPYVNFGLLAVARDRSATHAGG
jgi:SAM-dependent methyltransferase